MKRNIVCGAATVVGLSVLAGPARFLETVEASRYEDRKAVVPIVFQAAGPTAASIQSMVDAFRAALGGGNNGNVAGPLAEGRREINWDGGGSATSIVATPFDGFLNNRGGRFTTRGTGFVQAPVEGIASTFNNPTYATIFQAFSPVRLFSPINSNVTNARFFVPGGGELPATTTGFGAVFSDVDQFDGGGDDNGRDSHGYDYRDKDKEAATTTIAFYDVRGRVLFTAAVPASKGDASMSFVGVRFYDARVAYVRIKTGNVVPGPFDSSKRDVVMMDDFIYGEPQLIEDVYARQELSAIEDN